VNGRPVGDATQVVVEGQFHDVTEVARVAHAHCLLGVSHRHARARHDTHRAAALPRPARQQRDPNAGVEG